MIGGNRASLALLLVAVASGVVAVRGQPQPGVVVTNAICRAADCLTLNWAEGPVTPQGVPLPAGTSCRLYAWSVVLCVQETTTCPSSGVDNNGCGGSYVQGGNVFPCGQRTNKC